MWVCGYKFRDKVWSFLVNGRTGKATGKVPVSVPKALFTALFAAGVIGGAGVAAVLQRICVLSMPQTECGGIKRR